MMKKIKTLILVGVMAGLSLSLVTAHAALKKGGLAPSFPALNAEGPRPMIILYFFKPDSKHSLEGLEELSKQSVSYKRAGISVVAVSQGVYKGTRMPFSLVEDDGKIFRDYGVQFIFPTTYVLGPEGKVADILQGGGPGSSRFISTVAQGALQMKKPDLSRRLYAKVLKKNPEDLTAQSGLAQVFLESGELDRAEAAFLNVARSASPEGLAGKAGLAAVFQKKGEDEKALKIAKEIRKQDPESGLVNLIEGDMLSKQGDQVGALKFYEQAINGNLDNDWQRGDALNRAARIYSDQGAYSEAELFYTQAIDQKPFSSVFLTDVGGLYEKQGETVKAVLAYQGASVADPGDELARLLERRAAQSQILEEDAKRQERIDSLVSELTTRFKSGDIEIPKNPDLWSSRPMTIAFLGLDQKGGSLLREGMTEVIQQEIAQRMIRGGRIRVVERDILEKLLAELKLGSSALADPETALKLGKLLAARLVVTGSILQSPKGVRLSLRVIDPETSEIKIIHTNKMRPSKGLITLAEETGSDIGTQIQGLYPLRGKIALVEADDKVILNLGGKHGVIPGIKMMIIAKGDPIEIDGKVIGHRKKKVGLLEIVEVEEGLSYGKLSEQSGKIEKNQRVLEVAEKKEK